MARSAAGVHEEDGPVEVSVVFQDGWLSRVSKALDSIQTVTLGKVPA